jgi:exopolysaccharide biosynthesis polyprenyl glycosylphosphotransferase
MKPRELRHRRWRLQSGDRRLLLIAGDLVAAISSMLIALVLWAQLDWFGFSFEFLRFRAGGFVILPFIWILLMVNNYDVIRSGSWKETLKGVLISGVGGFILYLFVYFTSAPGSLPRRGIFYFLFLAVTATIAWRWIYIKVFTAPGFLRRMLIIGAAESGRTMLNVYQAIDPRPFNLVGFVDDDPDKQGGTLDGYRVIGISDNLLELIDKEEITDLIVAIMGPMQGSMLQALLDAQENGVVITRMPVAYEELLGRLPINHLESDWVLRSFVDEVRISPLYSISKRLLDLAGAIIGLLVFILIFPWVSFAILVETGRPVLFTQDRLGKGGKRYRVLKFRTMVQDAEADGEAHWAKERDPRATRVGRVLRRTHLDEFPQFWNVLKGEMSLVGPRPERPELVAELQEQIPFYRSRLLTKPGITGWAQVNYGKGASIAGSAEKLEFDLYYIKHQNLLLDLWIIIQTIGSVLLLRGV